VIRQMQASDVPAVLAVSAAAFDHDISAPGEREGWRERICHPFKTDPAGAFVAERAGRIVGVAEAIRREGLWALSLLTVDPAAQSSGVGRELLQASLTYGEGTTAQLIVSSNDPRAIRLYGLAGFELHPTFHAQGKLRLGEPLPGVAEVVEHAGDTAELDAVARELRGGPLAPEFAFYAGTGSRIMRLGTRGYAVASPRFGVTTVAARDEPSARALLWAALAHAGDGDGQRPTLRWISGAQQWAIDLALGSGLQLVPYGALGVRGRPGPLKPYLPSPPFA
jgi:ribosomal protein S18 acetylase RimI-like enzyme